MRPWIIKIVLVILFIALPISVKAETGAPGQEVSVSEESIARVCAVDISLKVLTLNIHSGVNWQGQYDLDGLVSFIKEINPDIIGLQEVERFWAGSKKDIPKELESRLNMSGIFGVSLERGDGFFGNLILSKYPIVEIWTEKIPSALEQRSYAFIQIIKDGVRINFLTTHLGLSDADRLTQSREIIDLINAVNGPVIVTGDFNGSQNDISVKPFKESFLDLQELSGNQDKGTFRQKNGALIPRMDYIFASPDFSLSSFQVIDNYISDHLPLVAEVKLSVNPLNVAGGQNYLQN